MGACGIIEAIYTIKSLQSGLVVLQYDNHNITKCSFDTDGMITDKKVTISIKSISDSTNYTINSFGFW